MTLLSNFHYNQTLYNKHIAYWTYLMINIEWKKKRKIRNLQGLKKNKQMVNKIRQKYEKKFTSNYNQRGGKMVKGNFPKKRKSAIYDEKEFSEKNCFGHFLGYLALYLSAKNQKKLMKQFCIKSKKTLFLVSFWPKFAQKFFLKIELRHFLGLPFCSFVPKIRKN